MMCALSLVILSILAMLKIQGLKLRAKLRVIISSPESNNCVFRCVAVTMSVAANVGCVFDGV